MMMIRAVFARVVSRNLQTKLSSVTAVDLVGF